LRIVGEDRAGAVDRNVVHDQGKACLALARLVDRAAERDARMRS
jgi:hypothetical protein